MDLIGRQQILRSLTQNNVDVRSTFNFLKSHESLLKDIGYVYLFKVGNIIRNIILCVKQQIIIFKNLDVDFIILRAWKVHETFPIYFLNRKILKNKKPFFILDLRTIPVDGKKTLHTQLNQIRFNTSIKIALKYFDGLTVISEKLRDNIVRKYPSAASLVGVWTTGVDPQFFDPKTANNLRSELKLDDRFIVMYHGIFSPFRGLQQAIYAINILKNRYPDILLVLLGKGEGQLELESIIHNRGLENFVRIYPPVPFKQVPSFLNTADCGILPFPDIEWWNTSGPLKLNEYISMGKPVIVTDIEAHRSVLKSEPFAFYSRNENPENLSKAIISFYQSPNKEYLSKRAREFALKYLAWDIQANRVISLFDQIEMRKTTRQIEHAKLS